MNRKYILGKMIPAVGASILLASCSGKADLDATRAGAIQISLEVTTSDDLYPDSGDTVDWKMIFVPTPGNLKVNAYWDNPKEIFGVELGVYDRFGLKIDSISQFSGAKQELTVFLPEVGLHYIKLSAKNGRSVYSILTSFETNYDNFDAVVSAPQFSGYIDLDEKKKGKKKGESSGDASSAANAPASDPAPVAQAALPALPATVAGGVVAPMPMAPAPAPVAVAPGPVPNFAGGTVKQIDNKGPAKMAEAPSNVTPIVSDIRNPSKSIPTDVVSLTKKGQGTRLKLSSGSNDGVKEGSVGDVYVGGQVNQGARFKITKVSPTSSMAESNADLATMKKASKFIIKVP